MRRIPVLGGCESRSLVWYCLPRWTMNRQAGRREFCVLCLSPIMGGFSSEDRGSVVFSVFVLRADLCIPSLFVQGVLPLDNARRRTVETFGKT